MSTRDSDIEKAIRQRNVSAIVSMFFPSGETMVGSGFRTETDLWDFKSDCPRLGRQHENAWAKIAVDICAFHNIKGGVIIFGINDSNFSFCGCSTILDSKLVNDQLRRFLGDTNWFEYHREFIQKDQKYVGVLLIPPRGPSVLRFANDAPMLTKGRAFEKGDTAFRDGDSSRVLRGQKAADFCNMSVAPAFGQTYIVDRDFFRVLAPEYRKFVARNTQSEEVLRGLKDTRTSITAIVGLGGMGKTALATWAVIQAYEMGLFELIVSVTAKDRELTNSGIRQVEPSLTSFESLLNSVLEVTGFAELCTEEIGRKENEVRELLNGSNALLYVDNLETVGDSRIIQFLDDLPDGVRAITTSRRTTVRVAVRPIDLGPLDDKELVEYIQMLSDGPGLAYLSDLKKPEKIRIGTACDGIPLAINWALTKANSTHEALILADGITQSGKRGEELLEFTFRRVFDVMPSSEKAVLHVLSLFETPLMAESIIVGAGLHRQRLLDALDSLENDALVQRFFDSNSNDYCFGLLPVTRAFVYSEVCKSRDLEKQMRRRLTDYFEATDIIDTEQRQALRDLRQGKNQENDAPLVDLARAEERRGNFSEAEDLYQQALRRNPRSWRAARYFAEFQRHKNRNTAEALALYERAAGNAPARGQDRAIIFREWGIILRGSGLPNATEMAIEKIEISLRETPNDPIAGHVLANLLGRLGRWPRVIKLLAPLVDHPYEITREKARPLLLKAYKESGDIVKAVELQDKINGNV